MRALILANGPLGDPSRARGASRTATIVVAADGGARHADTLGVAVDVLVGDFDSIEPELLEKLERAGAELRRFSAEKDEIDLELALLEARKRGASEALVLGALGARWDQTLANVMLALSPSVSGIDVRYVEGEQLVFTMRGPKSTEIDVPVGSTVSLIPVQGTARGVRTRGLHYALDGESLPFGTPRGVSNVVTGNPATVSLDEGSLCVVVIEARSQASGVEQLEDPGKPHPRSHRGSQARGE